MRIYKKDYPKNTVKHPETPKVKKLREEISKILSKRLRFVRKEVLALSGYEVAKRTGLDDSNISGVELGQRIMTITTLFQLAKTLSISVDYMLGLSNKPFLNSNREIEPYEIQRDLTKELLKKIPTPEINSFIDLLDLTID